MRGRVCGKGVPFLCDPVMVQSWYPRCEISMGGRSLFVNLISLLVTDLDVISEMDFLSNYPVSIDCFSMMVVFQNPSETQVRICAEGVSGKCCPISILRASALLKQGCSAVLPMLLICNSRVLLFLSVQWCVILRM